MTDTEFKQPNLPDEKKDEGSENKVADEPVQISIRQPLLDYEPPLWASRPPDDAIYKLEVIKDGAVVATVDMNDRKHATYYVIGRLPSCDMMLEHPSLSRYHCVLQYGVDTLNRTGKGWHLYDLESTHGTKANRKKVPPKQFIRMHIGWVLSFGLSTRSITLTGPAEEMEAEWEVSPTEMLEIVRRKELEKKLAVKAKEEFEARRREEEKDEGIDWGMGFDFETGDSGLMHIDGNDAHLMEDHEAYYRDDPRKALAKFFERESFDMEFVFTESGVNSHNHKWICSIELPIDTGSGRAVHASATVSTSKKDAQVQCALEACRILDSHGVLRKSTARAKLKKKTLEDEDYYEEDDDEYLDRTGQVDIQRERRKNRAQGVKVGDSKTHTYESILEDLEVAKKEIEELNKKYDKLTEVPEVIFDEETAAALPMTSKHDDLKTKTEKSKIRQRITELTHQVQKLEQLAKIAKPVPLPAMNFQLPSSSASTSDKQAFFRKLRQLEQQKKASKEPDDVVQHKEVPSSSEEFVAEEDDDEKEDKAQKTSLISKNIKLEEPTRTVQSKPKTPILYKPPQGESLSPLKYESPISKDLSRTNNESMGSLEKHAQDDDALQQEKKRSRNQKPRKRKADAEVEDVGEYGEGMENKEDQYATWMPPTNQSGDGSTQLNSRFEGRY